MNRFFCTSSFITILVSALAVLLSSLWRRLPIDDAYITFRYARNLVSGHGLVFNVGHGYNDSSLGTHSGWVV